MSERQILRLIDANVNRVKEGLRVCEDMMRFVYEDEPLTCALKEIRHQITALLSGYAGKPFVFLKQRSVEHDVGRTVTTAAELRRDCPGDIFFANVQRVKESLRVLEEFFKLYDRQISRGFKVLRYQVYALELSALRVLARNGYPQRKRNKK